jgi:sugar lactone lactonase YvrE
VLDAKATLGEGPVWDDRTGELVWVDIVGFAVHRFDPATGTDRAQNVGRHVGAAIPCEDGSLLLALEDGFAKLRADGELDYIADTEADVPETRMNDAEADPAGRLFAGTMAFALTPGVATLYRVDRDHSVRPVVSGMTLSNGLGWSPDRRVMYLIDSLDRRLDAFDYDVETGEIANRRQIVEFPDDGTLPDGMTVDAEGQLWVAIFRGGTIRRFEPDGTPAGELALPVSQPTACAFGGPDLEDLYITTTRILKEPEELDRESTLGGLFRCRPGVKGLPANRFAG